MAKKPASGGSWKKGQSGNPAGRKPIISPVLQAEVERNKAALKQLVLTYFSLTEEQIGVRQRDPSIPYLEKMLGQCFERTTLDGDVDKFRKLLEIVFGKLPEEPKDLDLSPDEKLMIITYRERLLDEQRRAITAGLENDQGTDQGTGKP